MTYSAAISTQVERANAAIRAIARDPDAIGGHDALQEIGALVMREIESISAEAEILSAALARAQRRKANAR